MRTTIAGALVGVFVTACFPVYCQSAPPYGAPKSMRLCSGKDCRTLTWNGVRYDGRLDGENSPSVSYTITRWQADGIELRGKTAGPIPNSTYYITAVFTGRIAQGAREIVDASVTWHIGSNSGTMPFSLTWKDDARVEELSGISTFPQNKPPLNPETVESSRRDGRSWVTQGQSPVQTRTAPSLPQTMLFCDVNCVTLRLHDGEYSDDKGNELWRVEAFATEWVKFTRSVKIPSFSVTYAGKVSADGYGLVGVANPFWGQNGQPKYILLAWDAMISQPRASVIPSDASLPLPAYMRFCDINCVTLWLEDGGYVDALGNERWTVGSFTRTSAEFTRTSRQPTFSVTYAGSVSEDGNRLEGVANPFAKLRDQPANIFLTWDSPTVAVLTQESGQYKIHRQASMASVDPDLLWLMILGLVETMGSDNTSAPPPHALYVRPPFVERRHNPR